MTYMPILARIRRLLRPPTGVHSGSSSDAFPDGTLRPPMHPMSDTELARAIRQVQASAVADWASMQKSGKRFAEAVHPQRGATSMEHRGVGFTVVQTLSPAAWRWIVKAGAAEKSGLHIDRNVAIRRAKKCIDEFIKTHGQSN